MRRIGQLTGLPLTLLVREAAPACQLWADSARQACQGWHAVAWLDTRACACSATGKSAIHGWGAFAVTPHAPGDLLIEYMGELLRRSVADTRERAAYDSLVGAGTYVFGLGPDACVDATRAGEQGTVPWVPSTRLACAWIGERAHAACRRSARAGLPGRGGTCWLGLHPGRACMRAVPAGGLGCQLGCPDVRQAAARRGEGCRSLPPVFPPSGQEWSSDFGGVSRLLLCAQATWRTC